MRLVKILFTLSVALIGFWAHSVSAAEVEWKVKNRFPLFTEERDFISIEKHFEANGATGFLAQNHSASTLRGLLPVDRTAWNPETQTYDAKALFRREHVVKLSLKGVSVSGQCTWTVNGRSSEGPCEGISVPVEENSKVDIVVTQDGKSVAELHDKIGIKTRLIAAIGDSFASGEGNPDHPAMLRKPDNLAPNWFSSDSGSVVEADAQWWDRACHRSLLSWQALYALRQAVSDPHAVVRFISFSCSGAEIYDGFFLAQKKPPGDAKAKTLKYSQQEALVRVLCRNGSVKLEDATGGETVKGPARNELFGEYKLASCLGNAEAVDEILISFGGNDVGFAKVVIWGLANPDPKNHKQDPLAPLRWIGNVTVNKILGPVPPGIAAATVPHIGRLYRDLAKALTPINGGNRRTVALVYPDPLPAGDYPGCRDRTRDGNWPLGVRLTNPFAHHKFGLPENSAKMIRSVFINPLRTAQFNAIANSAEGVGKGTWLALDANDGLALDTGSPRTICGTEATCVAGECGAANRLTWDRKDTLFAKIAPLSSIADFRPYDPERIRGLRSASDALLTQSVRSGDKVAGDWISGVAHPTAAVHASIADRLFELHRSSEP